MAPENEFGLMHGVSRNGVVCLPVDVCTPCAWLCVFLPSFSSVVCFGVGILWHGVLCCVLQRCWRRRAACLCQMQSVVLPLPQPSSSSRPSNTPSHPTRRTTIPRLSSTQWPYSRPRAASPGVNHPTRWFVGPVPTRLARKSPCNLHWPLVIWTAT